MKIQITEADIQAMTKAVVEKILNESSWYDDERGEDFTPGPDNTETLDMENLIATCLCNYFMENKQDGLKFMQANYPNGLQGVQEYGYEDMIEEACSEVIYNNIPEPEIKAEGYGYSHPSGDRDIPDDNGISYNEGEEELKADLQYLAQKNIPQGVIDTIKYEAERFMEDPDNFNFEFRF